MSDLQGALAAQIILTHVAPVVRNSRSIVTDGLAFSKFNHIKHLTFENMTPALLKHSDAVPVACTELCLCYVSHNPLCNCGGLQACIPFAVQECICLQHVIRVL